MVIVPSTHAARMPVPPIASEPTSMIVISVPSEPDTITPTTPVPDACRTSSRPTVKPSDLGLPSGVDSADRVAIDVYPRRPVVDNRIADFDVPNIDRAVIESGASGHPRSDIRDRSTAGTVVPRSVANPRSISITRSIADSWAIAGARPIPNSRTVTHSRTVTDSRSVTDSRTVARARPFREFAGTRFGT
ncbi:hypothetical protein RRSWK_01616 [Rhodopirellula sp. SWK7]|nr:hypothetical protein RRSWK_01616 [Rhodopirellula sp. SWK7]